MSHQTINPIRPQNLTRRAWLAVATTPVGWFLGFLAGEAMGTAFGYDAETNPPSWFGGLLITVVAFALMAAGPLLGVWWARAAQRAGDSRATGPLVAGAALAAVFAVTLFGSWLMLFFR